MTQLTTAFDNALKSPAATIFGAIEIDLPGYTLRLLEGSGFVTFGGGTFVGVDPTFGVLSTVTSITDGSGDQAPAITLTLIPSGDAAAASLAAPNMQGCAVDLYLGAIDPVTGLVIPDPYLLGIFELDVPTLKSGQNSRTLEYECVSVMERLFANDEGIRLSSASHQAVWPGEAGFNAVTNVDATIYWGVAPPVNLTLAYNNHGYSVPGGGSLTNGQRLSYV